MNVLELYNALRSALKSTSTQHINMKDIMYVCGEIFTSRSCGLTDDWFLLPAPTKVKRSQRRSRSVLAPPGGVISYAQVRDGIPNRWPASLKFARQNLMWMRLNNLPCVILSLDLSKEDSSQPSSDPAILVFPICTSMLRRSQSVPPNSLTSFDGENVALGNVDKRTVDFALAMRDFADRELKLYPQCKWYVYPTFIMDLLASQNEFRAWRNRVERSSRGRSGQDNRKIYLEALLEQHEDLRGVDERCLEGGGYPWDDSIIVPPPPPTVHVEAPTRTKDGKRSAMKGVDSLITATSPPDKLSAAEKATAGNAGRAAKTPREKKEKVPPPPPPPPPPRQVIMSNLFWVDKIGLPCIFYDYPGMEKEDKFNVLPISTVSRKYDTQVSVKEVRELTVSNLKNCNEERTRDLGEALLMLYQWREGRDDASLLNEDSSSRSAGHIDGSSPACVAVSAEMGDEKGEASGTAALDEGEETPTPFQWPDFVLDLLVHTWKVWSSGVERNMAKSGKQDVRVSAYFSKLKEQYIEMLRESAEGGGTSSEEEVTGGGSDDTPATTREEGPVPKKRRRSKKMIALGAEGASSTGPVADRDDTIDISTNAGPRARPHRPVSMSNLFWVPNLALPALFYDEEGAETNDSFFVFPFSASSTRYYMMMKASSLRPLSMDNIANCLDTHTRCFGEALMKFCDWERKLEADSKESTDGDAPRQSPYVWPDFILDLVAHRSHWTSWRREAERGWKKFNQGSRMESPTLSEVYLEALKKDYCDLNDLPWPSSVPTPEPKVSTSARKLAKSTPEVHVPSCTPGAVQVENVDTTPSLSSVAEEEKNEKSSKNGRDDGDKRVMDKPRTDSGTSLQTFGIESMAHCDADPVDDVGTFLDPPGSTTARADCPPSGVDEDCVGAHSSEVEVSDSSECCDAHPEDSVERAVAALSIPHPLSSQGSSPEISHEKKRPFTVTRNGDNGAPGEEDAVMDNDKGHDAYKRARCEDTADNRGITAEPFAWGAHSR